MVALDTSWVKFSHPSHGLWLPTSVAFSLEDNLSQTRMLTILGNWKKSWIKATCGPCDELVWSGPKSCLAVIQTSLWPFLLQGSGWMAPVFPEGDRQRAKQVHYSQRSSQRLRASWKPQEGKTGPVICFSPAWHSTVRSWLGVTFPIPYIFIRRVRFCCYLLKRIKITSRVFFLVNVLV